MKARHLIWTRRISQVVFFFLFLVLLVESRLPEDVYLEYSLYFSGDGDIRLDQPLTFFFDLDPLVWLSSLLSGHRLIHGFGWAVAVLVLTLFLGRIFCGFICPLGTIHHAVSWIRPALKAQSMVRANQKTPAQRIKYFLLIAVLVSALMGLNLAGLIDPIALLFRSLALAVVPAVGVGIKGIFDAMAASDIKLLNYLSYGGEALVSPVFGYGYPAYQTAWFIGLVFLVILFLNRIRPRFWCRVLCPLGALLGICSRFSVLRLEKDHEKCTDCKLCSKTCQGAASPAPGQDWENAECVLCFNCFHACPEEALSFRFRWRPTMNKKPDMGRRAVLTGLAAGMSLPLLTGLDSQAHHVSDPRLIRPPGALPEKDFLRLCQRCGLCMKVCPTNAINPTLGEAGLAGFWTPHLIMTQGYCEYTCTLCGSVCPTGAITEISAREKIDRPIRIGSAYVDRGRCLPWSGNGPCIVCQELCPTSPKAIYLKKEAVSGAGKTWLVDVPRVDLKRCVGCGICETKCPVKGKPAITVIAAGESRSIENQILLPDLVP
ncbi:MAG: 4Fe-4S binding protein [Thermodesulfobacteriota bacterium]|nr:4Fe-4S binding protein [Thermodesulfobacteriota bacterium]